MLRDICTLSENCLLLGTDDVRGQICWHVLAPNEGYCLYIYHDFCLDIRHIDFNRQVFSDLKLSISGGRKNKVSFTRVMVLSITGRLRFLVFF